MFFKRNMNSKGLDIFNVNTIYTSVKNVSLWELG